MENIDSLLLSAQKYNLLSKLLYIMPGCRTASITFYSHMLVFVACERDDLTSGIIHHVDDDDTPTCRHVAPWGCAGISWSDHNHAIGDGVANG